nr:MAG TPA: hypothetical protein [Caudoviricetes sp.]
MSCFKLPVCERTGKIIRFITNIAVSHRDSFKFYSIYYTSKSV